MSVLFYQLLESYVTDKYFVVKHYDGVTDLKPILSGVAQRIILRPILCLGYAIDICKTPNSLDALSVTTEHRNKQDS